MPRTVSLQLVLVLPHKHPQRQSATCQQNCKFLSPAGIPHLVDPDYTSSLVYQVVCALSNLNHGLLPQGTPVFPVCLFNWVGSNLHREFCLCTCTVALETQINLLREDHYPHIKQVETWVPKQVRTGLVFGKDKGVTEVRYPVMA